MLEVIEKHLIDYAKGFFSGEKELDTNIQLKLSHMFRVKREAADLIKAEALPGGKSILRAALLHDYSRFEQFRQYRTFCDAVSIDHGEYSAELIAGHHLLDDFPETAQSAILAAIRAHNKIAIPETLTAEAKLAAQVVRDADKLDIIPILIEELEHPANDSIIYNLSAKEELTPAVREALFQDRCPSYTDMRTYCDFVSAKYLWFKDLNFRTTRAEFRRRGYPEALRRNLPDTADFQQLYEKALQFLCI